MLREFKKNYRYCNVDKEDYDFHDLFTLVRECILFTYKSKLKSVLIPEYIDKLILDLRILDSENDN
jgi:hypothetical protein